MVRIIFCRLALIDPFDPPINGSVPSGVLLEAGVDPAGFPPWVTNQSALKAWYENANALRHAWRDIGYTYLEMSFLRKMDRPFEEFADCRITLSDYNHGSTRIALTLYLEPVDAHALAVTEGIDHRHHPERQPFGGFAGQPVWSSAARYELRDLDEVAHVLVPVLCLCGDDVHPYSQVLRGAGFMWSRVRAMVRARAIALYWQERTQCHLCAPDGVGRMLDQLAYAQWNLVVGM